jgi:hypothetical protein
VSARKYPAGTRLPTILPLHVGEAGDDRVDLVVTHGLLMQPKVNMPGMLLLRSSKASP